MKKNAAIFAIIMLTISAIVLIGINTKIHAGAETQEISACKKLQLKVNELNDKLNKISAYEHELQFFKNTDKNNENYLALVRKIKTDLYSSHNGAPSICDEEDLKRTTIPWSTKLYLCQTEIPEPYDYYATEATTDCPDIEFLNIDQDLKKQADYMLE